MPKVRKPMLDYAVYLAVRVAVCVLQALPVRAAFAFAEALAWLAYHVDRRHRTVAAENLRHAFPDRDPDPLVRECYRHFAGVAVEIALLPRKLHVENWRKYVTLVHPERIVPALIAPRPLLIVTAHFGNWEMAGFGLGALGFRTYAIARVLDNPHLERFLKQFRQKTGQTIIAKKDDFDRLSDVMRGGGQGGDSGRPGRGAARRVRRVLRPAGVGAQGRRAHGDRVRCATRRDGHATRRTDALRSHRGGRD